MSVHFPKNWLEISAGDAFERVVRPVSVLPDQLYQEIGIRSHGKGIFHKPIVPGRSLSDKRVFWVEPDCLILNIVFAWEQAVARTGAREAGLIASHRFPMYRPKDGRALVDFVLYFLKSKFGKKLLEIGSPGGAGRNKTLSQREFEDLPLRLPPAEEQQRIVAILETWDRAIENAEQLIAAERERFDGLLNKTIGTAQSRLDSTQPWSRKELGELVTFKSGGTPDRANAAFWGGDIPWVSAKDLKTYDIETSLDQLTADGLAKVNDAPAGSILILVRGMGLFKDIPIGVTNKTVSFNQDIKALVPKSDIVPRFLGYALRAKRRSIMDRVESAGHGTGRLSSNFLESLPMSFPDTRSQKKIVDLLDSAERELNLKVDYLLQLRTQKHGLMQKLLTGEWRLDDRFDAEALSLCPLTVGGRS